MQMEAGHFFRITGIGDSNGRLFGEDADLGRILLPRSLAAKQCKNPEDVSVNMKRCPTKLDTFLIRSSDLIGSRERSLCSDV
jgi:hypothetical protein